MFTTYSSRERERERERENKPHSKGERESIDGHETHLGYCHGASITRHGYEKKLDIARTVMAREHKGVGNEPMNGVIYVRTANRTGRVELKNGGVADLTYPASQTRRGRVIENGNVSPTLCHTNTLFRIEVNDEMQDADFR